MGKPKNRHAADASLDSSNTGSNDTQVILTAIENSLAVLVAKLDRQGETIIQLTADNQQLQKEVTELKQDQQHCLAEISFLKSEMNILQQEKFNCDIVISNAPVDQKISTAEIVDLTLQYVSFKEKEQVIGSYDVIKKKFDGSGLIRNVFVKFCSPQAQNKFLAAKKAKGPMFHHQMFGAMSHAESTKEMYINERLTNQNLALLREARRIQKKGLVKYAWHQQGSILIREQEGADIKKVKQLKDVLSYEEQQATQ